MMKRLLVLMVVVVGAAQQGPANEWTSMPHQAKITFANGINVGVAATLHMENGGKRVDPNADLVKELDEFYKVQPNWRVPLEDAVAHILMASPRGEYGHQSRK
jgi:hypothetical protein